MRSASAAVLSVLAMLASSGAAGAQQQPAAWRLTPELRIGSESQGAGYQFTRITGVVALPDGSVYVADSGFDDISLFDSAGVHVRRIGGEGAGPGEFRRLASIGVLGDTLWALDSNTRRASLFALDGTLLATISNDAPVVASGSWNVHITALLPGGRALGSATPGMSSTASRDLEPVLLLTRSGTTIDTLAWVSAGNRIFLIVQGSGGIIGSQPFSDAGLVIPDPARSGVFVVDRSAATDPRSAALTVRSISLSGDTLWTAALPYAPVRVDRDSAESFVSRLLRGAVRSGISEEEIRRNAFTPDYLTPVSSGVPGTDGRLWLRRDDRPDAPEYCVIGPTGIVATLTVPANATIMAVAGDVVWAVEKDEYDVPSVVRYRLHRD